MKAANWGQLQKHGLQLKGAYRAGIAPVGAKAATGMHSLMQMGVIVCICMLWDEHGINSLRSTQRAFIMKT